MAFALTNFQPAGGQSRAGNAPQIFTYRTADTLATVDTSGYFNSVAYNLKAGDLIHVTVVDAVAAVTAVTAVATLVVASSASGVVDTFDAHSAGGGTYALNAYLADVSTAGQIYVPVPIGGNIVSVHTALNGVIATADAVLTVKAPDGTVGTITITASGSAAGDVDTTAAAPANTEVEKGETVEIETSGASTNTIAVMITIVIATKGVDSD